MTVIAAPRLDRPHRYRLIAPNAPDTPQLARDHVAYLLLRGRLLDLADDARLLVSEVVTNVYQHTTTSQLAVDTTLHADRVRVGVRDGDAAGVDEIRPRAAGPGCDGGRGLMLVDRLAARWGVTLHGAGSGRAGGKTVWFVLRRGELSVPSV